MNKIELDGGKYTYICEDGGKQYALRHGEPWRDLTGDNLVYWLAARILDLEEICAEAYQVVGTLADGCGRFDDDDVNKILDNLSQLKTVHTDVLPFESKEAL